MKANNAYWRDPDIARGFNSISGAILGSASGDAAYELARKRRAEAIAANLKNEDTNQLRGNRNVVQSLVSGMFTPEQTNSWTDDEWSAVGGLFAQDENLMKNIKTSYLAPKQGSVLDAQAGKELAHKEVFGQQSGVIQDKRNNLRDASNMREVQAVIGDMFGINPEISPGPPNSKSVYPENMPAFVSSLLSGSGKSGGLSTILGLKNKQSEIAHGEEIRRIELEKERVEKEIVDTKALIQNSKLTEQQYKAGEAQLAKLQKMVEMLTAEQGHFESIAKAEIAVNNLAVAQAEKQNEIDTSNNNKAISDQKLKDAKEQSSFDSDNITHERDINKLEKTAAELKVEIAKFKVDESSHQADTAFSVLTEQLEDRNTKRELGEQNVLQSKSITKTIDIKKEIAEIQKLSAEELRPFLKQEQELKNAKLLVGKEKIKEEIISIQRLRFYRMLKDKNQIRAIQEKLAAHLKISTKELNRITSQAEEAATKAQSTKDLAPGLKNIQDQKLAKVTSEAELFAEKLKVSLNWDNKMGEEKYRKLLEQIDLIQEQITGQTIDNRISEVMLDQTEKKGDLELALKEVEIELKKKKSEGASLQNMKTHEEILIKQAPEEQKAASLKKSKWGKSEHMQAEVMYEEALYVKYAENPIWVNRIPEAVRIQLKNDGIADAGKNFGDANSQFSNNFSGAMSEALGIINSGVIVAKSEEGEVGIPNQFLSGVKRMILKGEAQGAKAFLTDLGYTGVQAEIILKHAEKSNEAQRNR